MSNAAIHIAFGDTHYGCQMALIGRTGGRLDNGGWYKPSKFQRKLFCVWQHTTEVWIPEMTGEEKYDLFHLGDSIEGDHHGAVSQWTHNLTTQENGIVELLEPVVARCKKSGGDFYVLRGTEAHGRPSGQSEENVARRLGATPNDEGQYARSELWKWVGDPHRKFLGHYSHHIAPSSSRIYDTTAPKKELEAAFAAAAKWGEEVPDFLCFGHRHKGKILPDSGRKKGKRRRRFVVITPAWQGYTPLVHRMSAGTQDPPEMGAVAIILRADGELYPRDYTYAFERSKPE